MRRIGLLIALALTTVAMTGCASWNWSDPFHPTSKSPLNPPCASTECR